MNPENDCFLHSETYHNNYRLQLDVDVVHNPILLAYRILQGIVLGKKETVSSNAFFPHLWYQYAI